MKEMDEQERHHIAQVTSTMEIEDMPLDSRTIENLEQIASGNKTADQIIAEIVKEYKNG